MKTLKPFSIAIWMPAIATAACGLSAPEPTPTPVPTNTLPPTVTLTPTNTPRPSPTPRPTKTPYLAATQKYQAYNAEAKSSFDLGYFSTADGTVEEVDDFSRD